MTQPRPPAQRAATLIQVPVPVLAKPSFEPTSILTGWVFWVWRRNEERQSGRNTRPTRIADVSTDYAVLRFPSLALTQYKVLQAQPLQDLSTFESVQKSLSAANLPFTNMTMAICFSFVSDFGPNNTELNRLFDQEGGKSERRAVTNNAQGQYYRLQYQQLGSNKDARLLIQAVATLVYKTIIYASSGCDLTWIHTCPTNDANYGLQTPENDKQTKFLMLIRFLDTKTNKEKLCNISVVILWKYTCKMAKSYALKNKDSIAIFPDLETYLLTKKNKPYDCPPQHTVFATWKRGNFLKEKRPKHTKKLT